MNTETRVHTAGRSHAGPLTLVLIGAALRAAAVLIIPRRLVWVMAFLVAGSAFAAVVLYT